MTGHARRLEPEVDVPAYFESGRVCGDECRVVRAYTGARHHEVGAATSAGQSSSVGLLDDGGAQRLHRTDARVVAAVTRILLDDGHRVAATSARPGDGLTRGAQPDDEDAPGHSMMPGMLMKS